MRSMLIDVVSLVSYFGAIRVIKKAMAVTEIGKVENSVDPIVKNRSDRFNLINRINQELCQPATVPFGTFHPPSPQEKTFINSDRYIAIKPSRTIIPLFRNKF
jgi:hypothetical protein